MIKVLHIIKSLGRGGAEMLLQETLPYHHKNKYEFHYIYFLPWKNQMVSGIEKNGGIVKNFEAKGNLGIMVQARKVAAYIKQNEIEIIHCHLPWAGFLGRWVHRLTGVPLIYTEHNKQERYHWITRTLNKLTFNQQNHVVAVSKDVEESILKYIRPHVPVTTILNGVNVETFLRNKDRGLALREKLGIAENAPVVGTVAVFRFQKRLKEWVTVFKQAEKQVPGLRGIIVGEGLLREEIEAHIREEGMEEKIILPGLQTDVKPWYEAMDVFMMTSVFEGLPIALLEAMSMECAVVSTNAGGIKEVIRDDVDGLLKPVDDWKMLSAHVIKLFQNKTLLDKYGCAARNRVVTTFSMKAMVEQTEFLYQSIISLH